MLYTSYILPDALVSCSLSLYCCSSFSCVSYCVCFLVISSFSDSIWPVSCFNCSSFCISFVETNRIQSERKQRGMAFDLYRYRDISISIYITWFICSTVLSLSSLALLYFFSASNRWFCSFLSLVSSSLILLLSLLLTVADSFLLSSKRPSQYCIYNILYI